MSTEFPHRFLFACKYPTVDFWCIRRNGADRALCGCEVTADIAGVTEEMLKWRNVCVTCAQAYLAMVATSEWPASADGDEPEGFEQLYERMQERDEDETDGS